jgi:uncharacterized protein (TIGR03067 family)
VQYCPMFLIVAAGALAVAEPPTEDKDRIQGTWALVSTERDGQVTEAGALKASDVKMIFEGDRVLAKMEKMTALLGTFALDPSQSPKAYDRTYPDGRPRRGIYKLEGDTLTICMAGIGKERPKEFATKRGDGVSLVVYRRE